MRVQTRRHIQVRATAERRTAQRAAASRTRMPLSPSAPNDQSSAARTLPSCEMKKSMPSALKRFHAFASKRSRAELTCSAWRRAIVFCSPADGELLQCVRARGVQ